ncbi:MAG: hypothetical protein ACYC5O_03420, partial [Anaerolineae bacterium]
MPMSSHDRDVLRRLGAEVAEIAALPEQRVRADEWRRLNRLDHGKPLVWVNEICWSELGNELALRCDDSLAREYEQTMRRLIYQWRHLPVDMVVDDFIVCPLVVHESGYGIAG